MLKILKPKSEFSRNVLTLMTGTTIAQAIPIAISPILTRLYTPKDFGIFALYMSIASMVSVVATGRYELAIMLPKKDEDAVNIMFLSILIAFFVSISTFLIVFLFNTEITNLLGNHEISEWLYFIPITIFLTGIYQSFNYWSNRKKEYKSLAVSKIIQRSGTATSNIVFGFENLGGSGLILGSVMGQIFSVFFLGRIILKKNSSILKIKKIKIFALGKKFYKFPKFDIPSAIIYSLYTNMAVIFFTRFFEVSVSGFYFFAKRIIQTPFSFFIAAFSDVFYRHLSQETSVELIDRELNLFSFKIIGFITLPWAFVVYFSYFYVTPIFGEHWQELYKYIYIFSLPVLVSVFLAPYGHVLKIINRQEISMCLNLVRLIILSSFLFSYFLIKYNLMLFLLLYSVIDSLIHLFLGLIIDKLISNEKCISINFLRFFIVILFILLNAYLIL